MTIAPPRRRSEPRTQSGPGGVTERASSGRAGAASPGSLRSAALLLGGMLRTMRPHQWIKNVFVLAPLVFAKELFVRELLLRAGSAFAVFCLLAAAVYTINDIVDAPADRQHPIKCARPIASGVVPIGAARALAVALLVLSMSGAFYGPPAFAALAIFYFVLNLAYSFRLKKIAYVDVACIAIGFVVRVVAGGVATRIKVSFYLFACTLLLALFLGFGKRSHELSGAVHGNGGKQRAALEQYSLRALHRALYATGAASIAIYIAYTLAPATRSMFHSDWLWLTAPMPAFGVLRFLHLVRARPKTESPTQEMLRDVPFVLNLVLWIVVVVTIVYRLRPSTSAG